MSIENRVAIIKCDGDYAKVPPFHPGKEFPEYPFKNVGAYQDNSCYEEFRLLLAKLQLDIENYGQQGWNPLGSLIQPGQQVLIKPNLVVFEHSLGEIGLFSTIAHGSLIRAIVDYVYIALKGRGRIIIADSPIKEVDFAKLIEFTGLDKIRDFYSNNTGIEFETVDFRDLVALRDENDVIIASRKQQGDFLGYQLVDLKKKSFLAPVDKHCNRYRSTAGVYENFVPKFHQPGKHIYSIPKTLLKSDVIISVSKLKTHCKAGITLGLKNMVGITNEKRGLPHHRIGSPANGGDMFGDELGVDYKLGQYLIDLFSRVKFGQFLLKYLYVPFRFFIRKTKNRFKKKSFAFTINRDGAWYGNDTIWRTTLDLNLILRFSDNKGEIKENPQRKYLSIIDGIWAGEGNGPLEPVPRKAGLLLGGGNAAILDAVASFIMGFDFDKIPTIRNALDSHYFVKEISWLENVDIVSNVKEWENRGYQQLENLRFVPADGWRGHIER